MNTEVKKVDQKEVILNILNDSVIFSRLCDTIAKALNSGESQQNSIEENYYGVNTAFTILGIKENSPLLDLLFQAYLNHSSSSIDPEKAAGNIYRDWQQLLNLSKEPFTTTS